MWGFSIKIVTFAFQHDIKTYNIMYHCLVVLTDKTDVNTAEQYN